MVTVLQNCEEGEQHLCMRSHHPKRGQGVIYSWDTGANVIHHQLVRRLDNQTGCRQFKSMLRQDNWSTSGLTSPRCNHQRHRMAKGNMSSDRRGLCAGERQFESMCLKSSPPCQVHTVLRRPFLATVHPMPEHLPLASLVGDSAPRSF